MNMIPAPRNRIDDLERCASAPPGERRISVLRRLRLTTTRPLPEGVPTRRGVIVDVETTGLDPATDEVLELAMLAFDYSIDGASVSAMASFDQLLDPSGPVPPDVTKLTGITDEILRVVSGTASHALPKRPAA